MDTAPAVIGYTSGAYDGWAVPSGSLTNSYLETHTGQKKPAWAAFLKVPRG